MNFKKLTSLVLVISMICLMTFSVFANTLEGEYTLIGTPSASTVAAGDEFTYSLYLVEGENTPFTMNVGMVEWQFLFNFDDTAFALKDGVTPTTNYGFGYVADGSSVEDGTYKVVMAVENTDITTATFTDETPLITFTLVALADASVGAKSFDFVCDEDENYVWDPEDGAFLVSGGNLTLNLASVTVEGGEEEFEATYEGVKAEDGTVSEGFAVGSKVATVFAKAEEALAAGEYGIVFGGQTYVGAAPVAAGKYWVIRLYDPSGEILTGSSYTCQKFVGEAVEAVDYKLETK